ncbi:LysM peptidoglycan-binding domain-containing protein [Thioalkalivibrio sp. ALE31]|uniref:LysM peptidoglycan-binding domain-containing protein n=1 Tax=Thioalkalivibrio sp. ALE31 TaxID=1158182 RepID=UPI000380D602|nr:LysM peptidoglycan-binding domain-containing protein [Thioalkalivibrio sp. ALE31]
MTQFRTLPLRLVLLAALAGLLPGCAQLQGVFNPDAEAEEETAFAEPPAPEPAAEEPEIERLEIAEIVQLLQRGEMDRAQVALDRILADEPRNHAARHLREQLSGDPRAMLGEAHFQHTVEPGETLARLAREHLGDANRFVILARYNDLERPDRLLVGQRLRIPRDASDLPRGTSDLDDQLTALDPDAAPGVGEDGLRRALEADLAAERYGAALEVVERARQRPEAETQWADWLEPLAREAKTGYWYQRGLEARSAGDTAEALEAFGEVLARNPQHSGARQHHAELEQQRKEALHAEAIVRYRNQDLDTAIALWDEALAIDPEFEAARGYRLRALELQRRLDALDG